MKLLHDQLLALYKFNQFNTAATTLAQTGMGQKGLIPSPWRQTYRGPKKNLLSSSLAGGNSKYAYPTPNYKEEPK